MAINFNFNNVGLYNTDGNAQDVLISGNTAYVADGSSGLQILDVTDPTSPSLSSTYSGGNYQKLSDFSFFSSTLGLFGFTNPIAVYEQTNGWDILNVNLTDPDNPVTVSVLDSLGISFTQELSTSGDGFIDGDYAYVADGASGLQIFNVDDITSSASSDLFGSPTPVTAIGSYDTDGTASGVFASGDYAYVADGDFGLQIIDVSTPSSPSFAGSYDTSGIASDVSVSGNFAYVADGSSGLQVIDVSDPSAPTAAYAYDTASTTSGVAVYGNYVYVADGTAGLRVLNFVDGSASNDSLVGSGSNKELMLGSSGADTLKGLGGADVLVGGADNDKLIGGGGADTMVGGMGNDTMVGGNGDDVLIGVNPYESNPGFGEKDVLKGSAGVDTFVLGDETNIFYHDDATTKAEGNVSRGIIKDFTEGEDIIQLNRAGTYSLVEINGSTKIYETSGSADDYIAIVSGVPVADPTTGVTGLDLADSSQFDYVGSVL